MPAAAVKDALRASRVDAALARINRHKHAALLNAVAEIGRILFAHAVRIENFVERTRRSANRSTNPHRSRNGRRGDGARRDQGPDAGDGQRGNTEPRALSTQVAPLTIRIPS